MIMTILENIDRVKVLESEVRSHPMCLSLTDEDGTFLVRYPDGDFPVSAVRVDYREKGKHWALGLILKRMEEHWIGSYPSTS